MLAVLAALFAVGCADQPVSACLSRLSYSLPADGGLVMNLCAGL